MGEAAQFRPAVTSRREYQRGHHFQRGPAREDRTPTARRRGEDRACRRSQSVAEKPSGAARELGPEVPPSGALGPRLSRRSRG
jgi:hypothetical protein